MGIESLFSPSLGWICSSFRCLIRRGNADTPEGPRDTSPNSETSTSTTHSVCGEQGQTCGKWDLNHPALCSESSTYGASLALRTLQLPDFRGPWCSSNPGHWHINDLDLSLSPNPAPSPFLSLLLLLESAQLLPHRWLLRDLRCPV